MSLKDKFLVITRTYGKLGLVVYSSISVISIGCCYTIVNTGIDVPLLLSKLGFKKSTFEVGGTFAIAYAVHKLFWPFRIWAVYGITRFLGRRYPRLVKNQEINKSP